MQYELLNNNSNIINKNWKERDKPMETNNIGVIFFLPKKGTESQIVDSKRFIRHGGQLWI